MKNKYIVQTGVSGDKKTKEFSDFGEAGNYAYTLLESQLNKILLGSADSISVNLSRIEVE